jgi:2-polyprenyl-6-methoxyphenol hydroxylase-like FAD-dependent oxidoreductase
LAAAHGIHLEGLGGTNGGVIGALAAVGLAAGGNDGRVVVLGEWPDDLAGPQPLSAIQARGIEVRQIGSHNLVDDGWIDVGKHLRPNRRAHKVVLFVEPSSSGPPWHAVRLT